MSSVSDLGLMVESLLRNFALMTVKRVINNDIVFGRLIQTTSVKIGIETVSGGHLMSFEISRMEIFGCSLGNDSSFGKGFTYS